MVGPPRDKGPRNGNDKEPNSLTRIEGIGETKARWLKSIGIANVQDLARASADYLESQLKAKGHVTGRNEIEEKWIAQAQELVDEISSQQTTDSLNVDAEGPSSPPIAESPEVEAAAASSQQTTEALTMDAELPSNYLVNAAEPSQLPEATSEPEAEAEVAVPKAPIAANPIDAPSEPKTEGETLVSPSTKGDAWSTFASFAVEFQDRQIENRTEQRTIVRHVETDTVQSWASIKGESFKQWILGQVAQARPPEPGLKQPKAAAAVKIGRLRLLQPPETNIPVFFAQAGRTLSNSIRSDAPFTLEVSLELIGDTLADIVKKQVSYCVQWDAKNLAPPHEIISLGETEPQFVLEGQTSYRILLPEVILHAGIYRLQILILLQGIAALPTFFDALVLQVV